MPIDYKPANFIERLSDKTDCDDIKMEVYELIYRNSNGKMSFDLVVADAENNGFAFTGYVGINTITKKISPEF